MSESPAPAPRLRPDPREETLRTLAAACIVVASMKFAASLLVPVLLAAFFAMALLPVAERIQRAGAPAVVATILSFALGAILVLGLVALVATSMNGVEEALPRYEKAIEDGIDDATEWLTGKGVKLPEGEDGVGAKPEAILDLASRVVSSVGAALSDTIVVLLVMLFMMFERAALTGEVRSGNAPSKLQLVSKSVTDYLSVKTFISLLTGLFFGIACALIGVDFPVLWGLLAFLLNYIPNIGSVLAAVPPILIALVHPGPEAALLVLVANLLINGILGNVIEPKLMGQKVGLSALTIFLGLVFWSWVFGPVGTVLSVPLTIAAKLLFQSDTAAADPAAPPPHPTS